MLHTWFYHQDSAAYQVKSMTKVQTLHYFRRYASTRDETSQSTADLRCECAKAATLFTCKTCLTLRSFTPLLHWHRFAISTLGRAVHVLLTIVCPFRNPTELFLLPAVYNGRSSTLEHPSERAAVRSTLRYARRLSGNHEPWPPRPARRSCGPSRSATSS